MHFPGEMGRPPESTADDEGSSLTSISVMRSWRAASRTGCLPSPRRSTAAGTRALRWILKWSPATTAAAESAWRPPWAMRKLASRVRSMQVSTSAVTSAAASPRRAAASSASCSRSTPARRSLVSLARAASSAASIPSARARRTRHGGESSRVRFRAARDRRRGGQEVAGSEEGGGGGRRGEVGE